MKHDTQLTQEPRYPMDAYRKAGLNQTETAEKLRVDKSTISREIRRNRGPRGDRAQPAQKRCLDRRAERLGGVLGTAA
jgi:IS30 family transposase